MEIFCRGGNVHVSRVPTGKKAKKQNTFPPIRIQDIYRPAGGRRRRSTVVRIRTRLKVSGNIFFFFVVIFFVFFFFVCFPPNRRPYAVNVTRIFAEKHNSILETRQNCRFPNGFRRRTGAANVLVLLRRVLFFSPVRERFLYEKSYPDFFEYNVSSERISDLVTVRSREYFFFLFALQFAP